MCTVQLSTHVIYPYMCTEPVITWGQRPGSDLVTAATSLATPVTRLRQSELTKYYVNKNIR